MDHRVLIVDDDQGIREMLAMVLADEGYSVKAASGGREALALAQGWRPGVILLDVLMVDMDGWTWLAEYRRDGGAGSQVLLVTAAVQAVPRAEALQVPIILKPFDVDVLLDHIRQMTDSQGR